MSVEFKVVYLGNRLVSVSTNSPYLDDWIGDIPLVSTERGTTSIYNMPDEQADHHYMILMLQK